MDGWMLRVTKRWPWQKWLNWFCCVRFREEVRGWPDLKHVQVTHTSSGKWNRGCPLVPVRPFVSGVEPRAELREGRWREIRGEGERESDWETSCDAQWKFWSLIGHLICWSYQGDWASDYPRDYLVSVCSCLPFFLSITRCTCLFLSVPLSLPVPATVTSWFSLCSLFFSLSLTLLYMNEHIWLRNLIRIPSGFCCKPTGDFHWLKNIYWYLLNHQNITHTHNQETQYNIFYRDCYIKRFAKKCKTCQ